MDNDRGCDGIQIRGKQRRAAYAALNHPRNGRQILDIAREAAPSMTYQDLRHILRDFEKSHDIVCLNPEDQTGRFYIKTTERFRSDYTDDEISLAAQIGRASMRLALLKEIAINPLNPRAPPTATQLRKRLRDRYPMSLNHALSSIQFLETNQLAEVLDYTKKRDLKIYSITHKGLKILRLLQPETEPDLRENPHTYTV